MTTEAELRTINSGINDIWKMIKKFLPDAKPDDEQYWAELLQTCSDINEKHQKNRLLQLIMHAVLDYIEEGRKEC